MGVFWRRPHTSIPEVNLAGLDPRVTKLIDQHLADVRKHPRSAAAWGQLGSLLQSYGTAASALACLAEAERLNPRDPRWPYLQAILLRSESPPGAVSKLRRTVALCGNDPETPRWRLATLLAEAGQWNEASSEIQALLAAKPEFTPAVLLNARRAQTAGNIPDAIELASRCTQDPRTARAATILLANLYLRQGDTNSAAAAQRKIAELPSDMPVADSYLAEAARLRGDPRVLTEQAHPLLAAGRLREVEPIVQQLMARHADNAEAWLVAGRLQLLKKELPAAEQSLKRHLELDPRSTQGLFQLGMVQLEQQRFAEAAQTFHVATQLKPDFGPAFYNRGFAFTRLGNYREAAPAFREAIRHNPERIDSYLMLADVELRLGKKEEALKLLQQAEPLNPSHPGLRQLREKAQRQQ